MEGGGDPINDQNGGGEEKEGNNQWDKIELLGSKVWGAKV